MESLSTLEHEETETALLSPEDIERHLSSEHVKWISARELLENGHCACIDGRCTDYVAGSPGGDAGNFMMQLTAVEKVTGKKIDTAEMQSIFDRYLEHHHGTFYMHSDKHAFTNLARAVGVSVEELPGVMKNPGALQDRLELALVDPENIGCGHLKLMLTKPENYPGVRPELLRALILTHRRAENALKTDYVVLKGGHKEGAVVRIFVETDGPVTEKTELPLVKPNVNGEQIFVLHPQLEGLLDQQFAKLAGHITGIAGIDTEALHKVVKELRPKFLAPSATALAKDRPMYDAHVRGNKAEYAVTVAAA